METTVARIQLDNLVQHFGAGVTAVAGGTLTIADGEFMIFVGPSGCGKTTRLNMIAGLEQPTSGQVIIGDRVVTDLEPGERGLGMVLQHLALFPHMTVFENIAFGLRVHKVPTAEVRQRVLHSAATFQIDHLLPKKPAQCSGGEAQRVALARTMVTHPDIFLLDEPLSSLDAKLRVDMRTELKALHATLRSTFVYVTHDQAEAMTMADRIMVMRAGMVQQVGTPLEVYRQPANLFVATFFGTPTMHILRGQVSQDSTYRFRAPNLEIPLQQAQVPIGAMSRAICVGVRAGHIHLGSAGLPAQVHLTEPLGHETLVVCDYGGQAPVVARVDGAQAYTVGDRVGLYFHPEGLTFFDAVDGE